MTRNSSILPQSGIRFTHEWGEEMHVKSLSQDSTSTWHSQDSNPGPSDPEAKCLHRAVSLKESNNVIGTRINKIAKMYDAREESLLLLFHKE